MSHSKNFAPATKHSPPRECFLIERPTNVGRSFFNFFPLPLWREAGLLHGSTPLAKTSEAHTPIALRRNTSTSSTLLPAQDSMPLFSIGDSTTSYNPRGSGSNGRTGRTRPWEMYSAILSPTQARYSPRSSPNHNQTEARRAADQIQPLSTPQARKLHHPRRCPSYGVCRPRPRWWEPFDAHNLVKPADPIEALMWSLACPV